MGFCSTVGRTEQSKMLPSQLSRPVGEGLSFLPAAAVMPVPPVDRMVRGQQGGSGYLKMRQESCSDPGSCR